MVKGRVSVIIPGRAEPYFQQTVDSALERATGDVEVVAVVDGPEQDPPLVSTDSRVKIIVLDKSIGQRAAYNLGVRESSGEFVMKIDAHAMMSPGYDEGLKAHCPEKAVVLPEMRRLNVHTWEFKPRGYTLYMHFGLDLYCHFWNDYRKRPEAQAEYPEVMTGQGSCWFTRREWNDYIGLLDERVGSWGNVGIEISLRTWLCGGEQIANKNVWQAHWFRKDEGGFTYPITGRDVARAHAFTRDNYYFKDDAFEHQERPFHWLIDKFSPVPGWEAYAVDHFTAPRAIVYYTDSKLEPALANQVRKRLRDMVGPIPIISVSQEPLAFGENINVGAKPREYRSMYEQLLVGLQACPEGSIVYCCEHDVFYHPSHFAFLPPEDDDVHGWFNTNRYYYSHEADTFLKARSKRALSHVVAKRDVLIRHCEDRLARWDAGEETRMDMPYKNWASDRPNVDVRHGGNLTPDGDYKRAWKRGTAAEDVTVSNLPGWGGVHHFRSKTGYKKPEEPTTDTADYLRRRFKRWLPQVSPVRIARMKRSQLPGLFHDLGFKAGAEVGVCKGEFSERFLKTIPDLELHCVDLWDAYYHFTAESGATHYEIAKERLGKYAGAHIHKGDASEMAKEIPDGSLDFVYIDADHRFDGVMQDLIVWGRKVRPGGIISGHDYYRTRNFGVQEAVDLYCKMHAVSEYWITDEKEASFFWAVPMVAGG